jgi:hypothetical protein
MSAFLDKLFGTSAPGNTDVERERQITKAVRAHCRVIGCDESNTVAAVAWALRDAGHTLAAVRAGNRRADQLRQRQAPQPGQLA